MNERKSWMSQNVATVAEMVSFCPTFWEICGIDPSDPVAAQEAARLRTRESNVMYFVGSADVDDPVLDPKFKLAPRKRRTRDDWINDRPLATVMHVPDDFEINAKGTGTFSPTGIISVVVEKNCLDTEGNILGDGDMPSEESANDWIDTSSNLMEELFQIASQNRSPRTNKPYPPDKYRLSIRAARLAIPPHFSTLEVNHIYGPHFIVHIHLRYGF